MASSVRIALLSTPRSGNTWLRRMLARTYDAEQAAHHVPAEVPWQALPERVVLQLHWLPEPWLVDRLKGQGFFLVALARHPLDVLISILHFASYEPETKHWLRGAGGDETTIHDVSPVDRSFLDYATGPRARAVLAVTPAWWARDDCLRVRYESLTDEPARQLGRLVEHIGSPRHEVARVAEAETFTRMRKESTNFHAWQGRPGLWRSLLPDREARAMAAAHSSVFDTLGYTVDPDERLTDADAMVRWWRMRASSLRAERGRVREELVSALEQIASLQEVLAARERELASVKREHAQLREWLGRSAAGPTSTNG